MLHTDTFLHSSPQLPVCFILRQLYISRCAESVIRRAFGVSLPVSACGRLPDSGSALPDSLHHSIPAMAGSAKSQGDHGIHTGVVFNGQVTAKYVIVAGNAYLGDKVEPELAKRSMPCGTQVITTERLSEDLARSLIPKNYCVEDCNYLLDYYRLTADNRLLYGGGVVYGARDPDDVERLVVPKLLKTFPQLKGVKIDYRWTGNFLLTLSRMPQFGRLDTNIYYMQGYSGHGVTCTHLAGRLIAELLRGDAERFDAFANLPHYPFPGGRTLRVPFTAMGAAYYSLRDRLGV